MRKQRQNLSLIVRLFSIFFFFSLHPVNIVTQWSGVLHNEATIEQYLSRAEELLGREEEVSSA